MSQYEAKFKSSASEAAPPAASEDKIEESQSLSVSKGKDRQTESYDTDTFEEQSGASQSKSQSMEGSGSKKASTSNGAQGGINYWPGSKAFESDASLSQSKEKDQSTENKVFSANAMEEYLKKQEAKKAAAGKTTAAPAPVKVTTKEIMEESEDKYSDEFDSYSKS